METLFWKLIKLSSAVVERKSGKGAGVQVRKGRKKAGKFLESRF